MLSAFGARLMVRALPLVIALLTAASAANAQSPRARLGDEAAPVAYDLTIALNPKRMRTSGSETLDVRIRSTVTALTLNARGLGVTDATIDGRPARIEMLPAIEQVRVRGDRALEPGAHRVTLAFTGALHDAMNPNGLMRDPGNAYVMSLFEASTARTVFPCFDEPAFRAPFTLHVRAPAAWTMISNMPLRGKNDAGAGLAQSDFPATPPMSSYMLVIDGGPFAHVDGAAGSVPIRVFVRAGQEAHGRVMLADAERIVPLYERFFGRPFPLPKLDLVVVPGVLQTAFEGWGAITFYNEEEPFGAQFGGGSRGELFAKEMVAHEIAHQWAGDLVTMRWWRDTFVAEAVAQFSEREAMTVLFPELEPWRDADRDVVAIMRRGVRSGSRAALQPVATDIDRDDEVVFNQATYDKGAAVIEGWRDAVGNAAFQSGLRRYIGRFAGGSATFEDFWDALGGADGVAYGTSWLAQRGFPVVAVRTSCRDGRRTVTVAQTPFVNDAAIDVGYRAQRWVVPLVLRAGAQERRIVLRTSSASFELNGCADVDVSPGRRPYFIVRYTDAEREALTARAALSARDRQRLRDDDAMLLGALAP